MFITLATRTSKSIEAFAQHLHYIHAEVRRKLALSNNEHKLANDAYCCHQEFEVGDFVMARIRPKRFPKKSFKKLLDRAYGLFRNTQKLGPTGTYHAPVPPLPTVTAPNKIIDTIMDEQTILTPTSPVNCYLVCWKSRLDLNTTWITKEEFHDFHHINSTLLNNYQLSISLVESSSNGEE
ncbi:hypothetical protein K1719_004610 [Acacia pycnantha]|nr:hypothetical protein K1719_004610 [Acacia pycnantha]